MDITFEKFTKEYVGLYYKWAEKPYIKELWFQEGYEPKEKILEKIDGNGSVPFVIKECNRAIGYIQYYDLSKGCWKALQCEPTGTLGIDLFIGEEGCLNKGLGTELVTNFTDMMFNVGAKKIIVDPDPTNKRAIRCYEKAGFSFVRNAIDDVGKEIYIMEKFYSADNNLPKGV